jgi:trehalose 6-phosphate synthase
MNQRYARQLAPLLEPDDLIWVHDYHLFPRTEIA